MVYTLIVVFWLVIIGGYIAFEKGKKEGARIAEKEYRHTLLREIYGEKLTEYLQNRFFPTGGKKYEKLLVFNSYDYPMTLSHYSVSEEQWELVERLMLKVAKSKKKQVQIINQSKPPEYLVVQ
jgi:hypothetical protein